MRVSTTRRTRFALPVAVVLCLLAAPVALPACAPPGVVVAKGNQGVPTAAGIRTLCRFETPEYEHVLDLRSGRDIVPWARLEYGGKGVFGRLVLELDPKRRMDARLVVENDGVAVGGLVDPQVVRLYPVAPVDIGGWLLLAKGAAVNIRGLASDGTFVLTPAWMPSSVRPAMSVETQLRCEQLAFGWRQLPSARALLGLPETDESRDLELPAGTDIPVARSPAGPAVATLRFEYEHTIERLGTSGAYTHATVQIGSMFVHGWIATSLIQPARPGSGGGILGGLGMRSTPAPPTGTMKCGKDLTLIAVRGGAPEKVGSLRRGRDFTPGKASDGRTTITLKLPRWLTLKPGVTLAVPTEEIAGCGVLAGR